MAVVTITGSNVTGGSPGGGGPVGGATNLTTAGAVPFVQSAGVLTQDSALNWDSASDKLIVTGNVTASTLTTLSSAPGALPGGIAAYDLLMYGTQPIVKWINSTRSGLGFPSWGIASDALGKLEYYYGNNDGTGNINVMEFDPVGSVGAGVRFAWPINATAGVVMTGTVGIGITQGTSTGSAIDQTITWNSPGTVMHNLRFNVTDVASSASSYFLEFQLSGVNKFSVLKDGTVASASSITGTDFFANIGGQFNLGGRASITAPSTNNIILRNAAATGFGSLMFGSTNSGSFMIKANNGIIAQIKLSDDSDYAALQASRLQTVAKTVGDLPAAAAGNAGSEMYVTDANATTIGSVVAAGGSNKVKVWSDGSNWKIYAS